MFKINKLNENLLKLLIGITVLINTVLMAFSILPDHDPVLYGNIAKHIVLNNEWINLIFNNSDWLDKPHFPFWVTAFSFKLFGVSSFSYMLPGFIFHLLGAYYTFLLGQYLFNKQTGLLAALFYVSAAHLMLSSIDVKAEAYLLGEIMPACYYWLKYHEDSHIKFNYLLLGAVFTALAMMTKGVFVLVTIFGGLIVLGFYNKMTQPYQRKSYANYNVLKWSLALFVSFLFISPELISLYLQFDMHPEKLVFKHTHVSGIKWFFWDSQIGRFFNNGPITKHATAFHYLFFVHTFCWAFLPWIILFMPALYDVIKKCCQKNAKNIFQRQAYIYLLGSFLPTFLMFSASSFQLDHYTNIIIPFAALICAHWYCEAILFHKPTTPVNRRWLLTQVIIAIILVSLVFVFDLIFFNYLPLFILLLIGVGISLGIVCIKQPLETKAITYSVIAINLVLIFHTTVNDFIYTHYDAGYKINQFLNAQPALPIIEYQARSGSLSFHTKAQLPAVVDNPRFLPQSPYYLVIKKERWPEVKAYLGNNYQIIWQTDGIPFLTKPFKIMANLMSSQGLEPQLEHFLIIKTSR